MVAARHVANWTSPTDFDPSETRFQEFLKFLRNRVEKVDNDHLKEFDDALATRLDEWERRDPEAWGDITLQTDSTILMVPAGRPLEESESGVWETPTSMRNVDVTCGAEVTRYEV